METPLFLRCEYKIDPLGIGEPAPRLSWILSSEESGQTQSGYRIVVSSSPELLQACRGDLWDSGKVDDGRTAQIAYGGTALASGQRAWWAVRVWNGVGQESAWSEPAFWEMGLLAQGDWQASWIGPAILPPGMVPYLRRSFSLDGPIRRARLYVAARGIFEMHLNGARVGEDVLASGFVDFHKRVPYQTFDVTSLLQPNENVLGALLSDGWACGQVGNVLTGHYWGDIPLLLAQMEIEYSDGGHDRVVTDGAWKQRRSPIVSASLMHGERYESRFEVDGWDTPHVDDRNWDSVKLAEPGPGAVPLVARVDPPTLVTLDLPARSVREVEPGVFLFDLGQNMVGWARLQVQGPRGAVVRLRFGEMLNPDGTLYVTNLRTANATDEYTLRGREEGECWEPRFTFHGFRYVEISGYPGVPNLDAVTGRVVHADTPFQGRFECGDSRINTLYSNIVWGQRGNFLSVPTDCPQRDERLGWLADAQVFLRTAAYNADIASFMTKWLDDVNDAQSAEGAFSDVAPRVNNLSDGAPGWGDAGVIIPWTLYEMYADRRLLARCYPRMRAWIEFLHAHNPDNLWMSHRSNDFGDWLSVDENTPKDLLATAYFAWSTTLTARAAHALGQHQDAERFMHLARAVREAFSRAYVTAGDQLQEDTQTGYALAIRFGLVPALSQKFGNRLAAKIRARGNRLTTGFLGVGHLCEALTETGHVDVAFDLLFQDEFPSWLYSVKNGATTIWERWDGWTHDRGFQKPSMNSFNHYSLGSVGEWLFHTVAGIAVDPQAPGFAHVVMHPQIDPRLGHARATYDSIHGPITSAWRIDAGRLFWKITLPPTVTATVRVPAGDPNTVTTNGVFTPAEQTLGSGNWCFESTL